jgi:hypothetical protein
MQKLKNTISYLVLVLFGLFQCRSLIFYRFVAVGMREDVGGTTTGGERVCGSVRDGRAIFSMSLMSVAVRKAVVDGLTE